jgi:hypothetical protein
MRIRTYSELSKLDTFADRFKYLAVRSSVGMSTFGFERYLNQRFYTSSEWRKLRSHVIVRDNACDLGVLGHDIFEKVIIHHMNPMAVDDIVHSNDSILDPEYLITTTLRTHNAIHYGDDSILKDKSFVDRKPGDTKLW